MDYNAFYKDLLSDMKETLSFYGFRKSGSNFRLLHENGIAKEISIVKSRFNSAESSKFYVSVSIGLFPTPVTADFWKGRWLQVSGYLGETLEDGLIRQHWYDVMDTTGYTKWIHKPSLEEIRTRICVLLVNKAIPFLESIQTLDDYFNLITSEEEGVPKGALDVDTCALYTDVYGKRFLTILEKRLQYARECAKDEKPLRYPPKNPNYRTFGQNVEILEDLMRRLTETDL